MKKTFLTIAVLLFCVGGAFAQNYNVNIGGIQFSSGAAVPGSCPRDGAFFFKNTTTKNWYMCIAGAYVGIGTGASGVSSFSGDGTFITNSGSTGAVTTTLGKLLVANGGTGQTQAGTYGLMLARTGVTVANTGNTTENIVATATIPANLLTISGQIITSFVITNAAMTGTYTYRLRLGGIGGTALASTAALGASQNVRLIVTTAASGATNSQVSWIVAAINNGISNIGNTTSAVDMTASQTLVLTIQNTAAGDTVSFNAWNVVVYP